MLESILSHWWRDGNDKSISPIAKNTFSGTKGAYAYILLYYGKQYITCNLFLYAALGIWTCSRALQMYTSTLCMDGSMHKAKLPFFQEAEDPI